MRRAGSRTQRSQLAVQQSRVFFFVKWITDQAQMVPDQCDAGWLVAFEGQSEVQPNILVSWCNTSPVSYSKVDGVCRSGIWPRILKYTSSRRLPWINFDSPPPSWPTRLSHLQQMTFPPVRKAKCILAVAKFLLQQGIWSRASSSAC